MKTFSIFKPQVFQNNHPQEDYFLVSKKYPIFVVADGVTLNSDTAGDYPNPSGAGEAAKIFCGAVISEAEKRYESFKKKDIKDIFKTGNKSVLEYNNSRGRTEKAINFWDFDFFSATTSFLLIKNNKAYWWSLCDSGIAQFDKKGKQLFVSPGGWTVCKKHLPANWDKMGEKEKVTMLHKDYRNNAGLTGYGVVTGEESAELYLNAGMLDVNKGDMIFLYTDGFENYFGLKEFIDLFKSWPEDMENWLGNMISEKSKSEPKKYGSEKTLIAISV